MSRACAANCMARSRMTGRGHGTDKAVLLGFEGEWPDKIDPDTIPASSSASAAKRRIRLLGKHEIAFDEKADLRLQQAPETAVPHQRHALHCVRRERRRTGHARLLFSRRRFRGQSRRSRRRQDRRRHDRRCPIRSHTGDEMLAFCGSSGKTIAQMMLENEKVWRSEAEIRAGLLDHLEGDAGLRRHAACAKPACCPVASRYSGARQRCSPNCATSPKPRSRIR